jgi:adenylate kinase
MKKIFIFFFGPPGSGKGTQVDVLAAKFYLPVISPGELLRHEEEVGSKIGKIVKPLIDNGKMVDDHIVEQMINSRLRKKDAKRGALFDGFPRDLQQHEFIVDKLRSLVAAEDKVFAVLLNVSDREVRHRISGRRVCDCGASYHIAYKPPKIKDRCDLCGNVLTIRKDDRLSVINKRLKHYHLNIKPLLLYWKKHNKLYKVNGERLIGEINQEIETIVKKFLK